MTTVLTTAARNAACNAVVDLLDAGSGDAAGDIQFCTAGGAALTECDFSNPAFGNAATGVATASAIADGTVSGSSNPSTVGLAKLRNRDDSEVLRGAVAASGSDINLSSVSVNDGDIIRITALTYTQPA